MKHFTWHLALGVDGAFHEASGIDFETEHYSAASDLRPQEMTCRCIVGGEI